jgi:hypothetical protein
MTALQQTKKKRLVRMNEAYKQDQSDFDTIPAITDAFTRLEIINSEIDICAQKQILATVGTTEAKNSSKVTLANSANIVAGAIYSYALATKNIVLQTQAKYTELSLLKLSDTMIVPTCRNIYNLAITNADGLKNFIGADIVQQLLAAIDAYTTINGKPLKQIKDRGTETKKLAALFNEADGIFRNQTDKLVEQLKDKFPDTYNNYQIALALPQAGDNSKGDNPPPTPPTE